MNTIVCRLSLFLSVVLTFLPGISQAAAPPSPAVQVQLGATAPTTLLVQTGQLVSVSLSISNIAVFTLFGTNDVPKYQWLKDGVPLSGETNVNLTIYSASMADAGTYGAYVFGQNGRAESPPIHLGVYYLYTKASNGGVLTTPIGAFTFSGSSLPCSSKLFNHRYVLRPFYGPGAPNQVPPFANTSASTNLMVSTCSPENGSTLDTGLYAQEDIFPNPVVACSDDDGGYCANNSALSTCTVPNLEPGATYSVTLLYKKKPSGLRTIAFSWYYHD